MTQEKQKIESGNLTDLKLQLEVLKTQFDLKLKMGELRKKAKKDIVNSEIEAKFPGAIDNLKNYIFDHHEYGGILREKQATVSEDLLNFLEQGKTYGKIILPTGVGKTILFLEIVKALNLPSLIVVPTEILVNQTGDKINKYNPDLDYGKVYAKAKEFASQVTITTYDSLVAGIKTGKFEPKDYKLLVMDEAHESLTKLRLDAKEKFKSDSIILEFTATEAYDETKKLTSETIHEMKIVEAVEQGLLSPLSCVIAKADIDLSKVQVNINGEYNINQLEVELEKAGINKACVQLYKQGFMDKSTIVFVNSINRAKSVQDEFNNKFGNGFAEVLVGETKNQGDILARYNSGEIKVLVGVNMLTRGFDAPVASVCINLDPTQSAVKAAQKGGRVLRLDENNPNKHAIIVDFVYGDDRKKAKPVLYSEIVGQSFVLPKNNEPKEIVRTENLDPKNADQKVLSELNISGIEVIVNHDKVMSIFSEVGFNEIIKKQYSLEEIRKIVLDNGWKTAITYKYNLRHVADNLELPSYEELALLFSKEYGKSFSWDEFILGPNPETIEMPSLEEIRRIAISAGFRTKRNYEDGYKKFSLPTPHNLSKEYQRINGKSFSWDEFIKGENFVPKSSFSLENVGNKVVYIEMKKKAQLSGIRSSFDYNQRCNSFGLPSFKKLKQVCGVQTIDWDDFLGR